MDETDPEGAERRPHRVVMVLVLVGVRVQVEVAVPPADEQPDREEDDQRRDGGLGALLQALREELLEEQDREAEEDERERVPEAPERAEPGRCPAGALLPGGDECRDRGDVVGIRRVAQAEQGRDEDHDEDGAAGREDGDRVVEPEHVSYSPFPPVGSVPHQTTPGRARTVIATPTQRITSALTAGSVFTIRPSKRDAAEGAPREHGDEPDPRDVQARPRLNAMISASPKPIRCSAIALEEDDERRGAREDPGRDPDAEDAPVGQRVVVVVCGDRGRGDGLSW